MVPKTKQSSFRSVRMSQLHFSPRIFRNPFPNPLANAGLLRRMLILCLPIPLIALALLFTYSHHDVESTLDRAIARNSGIAAQAMGFAFSQILQETRNQIAALSAGSSNLVEFQRRLLRRLQALNQLGDTRFCEAAFVGLGEKASERYLWINYHGSLTSIPAEQAEAMSNSPLNLPRRQPVEHEVVLSSPTEITYSFLTPGKDDIQTQVTLQVLRFTTPVILTDGSFTGYLVLSINLDYLKTMIASFARSTHSAEEVPFVVFVDHDGWMLFQTEGSIAGQPAGQSAGNNGHAGIDSVRSGLRGDFGRAGFSQAFRPSADFYSYWTMMNNIQKNSAGQFATKEIVWSKGSLVFETVSYAPVTYASGKSGTNEVIGGIVVLDPTFAASKQGTLLLRNYAMTAGISLLVLTLSILFIVSSLRKSLKVLRHDVDTASQQSQAAPLPVRDEPGEVTSLRRSVNSILEQLRSLQDERDVEDSLITARMELEAVPNMPKDIPEFKDGIIGVSREISLLRQNILRAAKVQADVLVLGETGTGKELVSSAVHALSDHRDGPFITINCGALDEGLLMDSLFGHVKGAYTEAKQGRKGAFLTAEGGTLMLDEIGTASLKVQQALLRALSDRCIYPLGSDQSIPFNTRVIAATNADLVEEIKKGTFREDLYFRLAVITIHTPPLRQHKVDIPYLVMSFLQEACALSSRPVPGISKGALSQLMHYHWPGNVRELRNTIFRTAAFCTGDLILPRHLSLGTDKNSIKSQERARAAAAAARGYEDVLPEDMMDRHRDAGAQGTASGNEHAPVPEESSTDKKPRADADQLAAGSDGQKNTAGSGEQTARSERSSSFEHPDRSDQSRVQGSAAETDARKKPGKADRGHALPSRIITLLPRLRELGIFSRQEYQDLAGISMRTAQYDLQELITAGYLERKGSGPSLRYVCRPDAPMEVQGAPSERTASENDPAEWEAPAGNNRRADQADREERL